MTYAKARIAIGCEYLILQFKIAINNRRLLINFAYRPFSDVIGSSYRSYF